MPLCSCAYFSRVIIFVGSTYMCKFKVDLERIILKTASSLSSLTLSYTGAIYD